MAYCIYLRKSRADIELEAQGEGETLERHKTALLNLAKAMQIKIEGEYREIVSGETITARPQMQRLLSDVEKGMWEGVLVMEVERLARGDTIDQGVVARTFKDSGTKIITPIKTYNPNDEYDEEYFEFGLFMARREYKAINRRIQRGRIASVKEGKYISPTPPYGYDRIESPDGKGYILTPNPQEAPTVKQIFADYISGMGAHTIAKTLTDCGVAPRVNSAWSAATVRDMLKNPVYMGKIRWAYRKYPIPGSGKRVKSDEYILVDGKHEPLVTESEFAAAEKQRKLNTKNTVRSDKTLQNPLAGLVYCKECGALMTRVFDGKRKGYAALACKTPNCPTVSSPLELVEKDILKAIRERFSDYEMTYRLEPPKTDNADYELSVKRLQNKLKTLDKQLEKMYNLVEQGVYTAEEFEERRGRVGNERAAVQARLLENEQEREREREAANGQNALPYAGKYENIADIYENCVNAQAKNAILKQIVKRAEYSKLTPNTRGNRDVPAYTLDIVLML